MKSRIEFTEATILLVIFSLIGIVLAQPGIPAQFYGFVKCQNNALVPDATQISIKTSNILIKSVSTLDGKYGFDPLVLVCGLEDNTKLEFYVNNVYTTSNLFLAGETINLDLSIDNSVCSSANPSSQPSGGGSGGGGGGGGSSIGPGSIISPSGNLIFPIGSKENNKSKDNNGNNSNPNIQPGKRYGELTNNQPLFKINEVVALNISILALIIMALITLYSLSHSKKENRMEQKVYK